MNTEQKTFIENNYQLMTDKQIGSVIDVDHTCINSYRLRTGLVRRPKPNKHQRLYIEEHYMTEKDADIAVTLGMHKEAVRHYRVNGGLHASRKRKALTMEKNSLLLDELHECLIIGYNMADTLRDLAHHNVTRYMIIQMINNHIHWQTRRTWAKLYGYQFCK